MLDRDNNGYIIGIYDVIENTPKRIYKNGVKVNYSDLSMYDKKQVEDVIKLFNNENFIEVQPESLTRRIYLSKEIKNRGIQQQEFYIEEDIENYEPKQKIFYRNVDTDIIYTEESYIRQRINEIIGEYYLNVYDSSFTLQDYIQMKIMDIDWGFKVCDEEGNPIEW